MPNDIYIPREELIELHKAFNKVRAKAEKELMKYPGVIAVGVGLKEVKGELQRELCFKVTVEKKKALKNIKKKDRIPETIYGYKTDVMELSIDELCEDQDKYRPLIGGIQVGTSKTSGFGTLGCFATANNDNTMVDPNTIVLLSCWHVLVKSGTVLDDERVGQPSHAGCCSCCSCNEIADVVDGRNNSTIDAAIAKLKLNDDGTTEQRFVNEIVDIGMVAGSAVHLAGETVFKRGRTTELTKGTISNDNAASTTTYAGVTTSRVGQLEITPAAGFPKFADSGDSGSALVNELNQVVGLVYAKSGGGVAIANKITPILTTLKISIMDSTFPVTPNKSGVPISSISAPTKPKTIQGAFAHLEQELSSLREGQRIMAVINIHSQEVLSLVNTNREVMTAWHRYKGPGFMSQIVQSLKRDTEVPAQINGISMQNLLLKMAAVLQRNGSKALQQAVDTDYLTILEVFAQGSKLEDWKRNLEKLEAELLDETLNHA